MVVEQLAVVDADEAEDGDDVTNSAPIQATVCRPTSDAAAAAGSLVGRPTGRGPGHRGRARRERRRTRSRGTGCRGRAGARRHRRSGRTGSRRGPPPLSSSCISDGHVVLRHVGVQAGGSSSATRSRGPGRREPGRWGKGHRTVARLGQLELKVMDVLWESMGTEKTVRQVAEELPTPPTRPSSPCWTGCNASTWCVGRKGGAGPPVHGDGEPGGLHGRVDARGAGGRPGPLCGAGSLRRGRHLVGGDRAAPGARRCRRRTDRRTGERSEDAAGPEGTEMRLVPGGGRLARSRRDLSRPG